MPWRTGRIEKRIQQAVPVEMFPTQHPSKIERASTENVSSMGARVLTDRPRELNELLTIRPLVRQQGTVAQVVYCQRLSDGRFGVGMRFLGTAIKWPDNSASGPIR